LLTENEKARHEIRKQYSRDKSMMCYDLQVPVQCK